MVSGTCLRKGSLFWSSHWLFQFLRGVTTYSGWPPTTGTTLHSSYGCTFLSPWICYPVKSAATNIIHFPWAALRPTGTCRSQFLPSKKLGILGRGVLDLLHMAVQPCRLLHFFFPRPWFGRYSFVFLLFEQKAKKMPIRMAFTVTDLPQIIFSFLTTTLCSIEWLHC